VSRIGGKAQIRAMKVVAEKLKIDYSRFTEVEVFTKFGAHVEEETAKLIRRGERMREILKQPRFHPFSLEEEFLGLLILETGVLDGLDLSSVNAASARITADIIAALPEIIGRIKTDGGISPKEMDRLREFIAERNGT
jgi:F-type H+-transporting ATPase subunit alpha